jgi:DNA-binding MarR family transcriptional regulator
MQRIVIRLSRQVKRQFRRTISRIKDAKLKTRYLIILHTAEDYSRRQIAKMLLYSSSTTARSTSAKTSRGASKPQHGTWPCSSR